MDQSLQTTRINSPKMTTASHLPVVFAYNTLPFAVPGLLIVYAQPISPLQIVAMLPVAPVQIPSVSPIENQTETIIQNECNNRDMNIEEID
jgi:hypothetical protein